MTVDARFDQTGTIETRLKSVRERFHFLQLGERKTCSERLNCTSFVVADGFFVSIVNHWILG